MQVRTLLILIGIGLQAQTGQNDPVGVAAPKNAPFPPKEELYSIAGTLLSSTSEQPVPKATIRLVSAQESHAITTDDTGKFALSGIKAGRFRMNVTKTGFATAVYTHRVSTGAGNGLFVGAGQALGAIKLYVAPHGVITGRIVGPEHDPIVGARVQILGITYAAYGKTLVPINGGTTNDLGDYRIFGLAPGKYVMAVSPQPQFEMTPNAPQPKTPKAADEYIQTYYPGTTSVEAATLIDVAAGVEVANIGLTLARTRTVSIRGKVSQFIEATVPAGARPMVSLLRPSAEAIPSTALNRTTYADGKGNFEFAGVAPGAYDLVAIINLPGAFYSGRIPVTVADEAIENVNIPVSAETVVGRVRVEGDSPAVPANLQIRLMRNDPRLSPGLSRTVPVASDGIFTIPNVSPDTYELQVYPLPSGFYLKAIRTKNRDLLLYGLDLMAEGVTPIDVVLSPHASTVRGIVRNAAKEPASAATVILLRQDTPPDAHATYLLRRAVTDQNGAFVFQDIWPGRVKILAWEEMPDLRFLEPEILKAHESQSELVTIQEGSQHAVQLKLIENNSH